MWTCEECGWRREMNWSFWGHKNVGEKKGSFAIKTKWDENDEKMVKKIYNF